MKACQCVDFADPDSAFASATDVYACIYVRADRLGGVPEAEGMQERCLCVCVCVSCAIRAALQKCTE